MATWLMAALKILITHVDLAGNHFGDQGGAILSQEFDLFFEFVDGGLFIRPL